MRRALYVCVLGLGLLVVGTMPLLTEIRQPVVAEPGAALTPSFGLEARTLIEGKASWYGPGFHGRTTASGEIYNRYALTAAHRTLRHGTVVRVTNLGNGRSTLLLINDWGPVPADRVIDVSEVAADVLGFHHQGIAQVRVEVFRAASD